MNTVSVKRFNELNIDELYQILRLRSEVFVVEQDCVYQDLDNKDQKALHLFISSDNEVTGYTRLFKAGDYFDNASVGRVVVSENHRDKKLGHILMKESIDAVTEHFKTSKITISAQTHLKRFYESHGFQQVGEGYLEDGIPHIEMLRE
jgi:ElaA protein